MNVVLSPDTPLLPESAMEDTLDVMQWQKDDMLNISSYRKNSIARHCV
jgi:hypothetical protein